MDCPQCGGTGKVDWDRIKPPPPEPQPAPDAGGSWYVAVRCPECSGPLSIKVSVDRPLGRTRHWAWEIDWGTHESVCRFWRRATHKDEQTLGMAAWYVAQLRENRELRHPYWEGEPLARVLPFIYPEDLSPHV